MLMPVTTVIVLLVAALSRGVGAECDPVEFLKLAPGDAQAGDEFGSSVDIDGNRLAVGAMGNEDAGDNAGAVYVYDFDCPSWIMKQKIIPSAFPLVESFGRSVSLSCDRLLIGAGGSNEDNIALGSAIVYKLVDGIWVMDQQLISSDILLQDGYGYDVGLSGSRAVVSAWLAEGIENNTGAVYVYEHDGVNWIETAKLTASNGIFADYFGLSVAVDGDRIAVGAPGADNADTSDGRVYVFDLAGDQWTETIVYPPRSDVNNFGESIDLRGDRIAVGAISTGDGEAFVLDLIDGQWQSTSLIPSDSVNDDDFGISIAIGDDTVLVGAWKDDDNGMDSGSAFLFTLTDSGWQEMAKILASDGSSDNKFGRVVDVSGENAIIGAHHRHEVGFRSGASYLFDLNCLTAVCGNGEVEPGEQCDDCNEADGDCCSSQCQFESAGTLCGDQSVTECSGADSCDGAGSCLANNAQAGSVCGQGPDDCSDQDMCNALGVCTPNHLPNGTPCGSEPTGCFQGDYCLSGTCVAGSLTTECIAGDDCCPDGCNSYSDGDCTASVPAVSSWGMLILAMLLLAVGKTNSIRGESTSS